MVREEQWSRGTQFRQGIIREGQKKGKGETNVQGGGRVKRVRSKEEHKQIKLKSWKMSKLLFKPKNFEKISLISTMHECKLATVMAWPEQPSKGGGRELFPTGGGLCEIKRQVGLKGDMGERKTHSLLKSELIN